MANATISAGDRGVVVTWDDGVSAKFPFIWLRDNDPGELHPDTGERVFDLARSAPDVRPDGFEIEDRSLVVRWPDNPAPSVYAIDWLRRHRPGVPRHDPSVVKRELWDAESPGRIPRVDAARCASDPGCLRDALLRLKRTGLVIVEGLDDGPVTWVSFGDLIGFRRETNFGRTFEVISKPRPNNLAYTALALPLHTDLPNQETIPGYQFLNCRRNSTTGGDSVFADGFRISEDLRADAPEEFELLTRVRLPFRFHDDQNDIRRRRAIISLDEDGDIDRFVFNAHIADVPDLDSDTLHEFYRAYRNLMIRMRAPAYSVTHRLMPGEMAVFDNARVLHSRTAFDPGSGERYFRGYYIERNEVDSRIRVLSRTEVPQCRWK